MARSYEQYPASPSAQEKSFQTSTPARSSKRLKKSPITPKSMTHLAISPVASPLSGGMSSSKSEDRFIPNRGSMDFEEAAHALSYNRRKNVQVSTPTTPNSLERIESNNTQQNPTISNSASTRPVQVEFRRAMRSALLPRSAPPPRRRSSGGSMNEFGNGLYMGGEEIGTNHEHHTISAADPDPTATSFADTKIFRFSKSRKSLSANSNAITDTKESFDRFQNALEVLSDPLDAIGSSGHRVATLARPVPTKPSRILDAPDIVDDYYLNLLSWSSTNILAVALANNVYLWNASTNEVSELLQLDQGDCVTSVSWAPGGQHLCVGTDSHLVQLWDATRMTQVQTLRGHSARVGSLAWNPVSRCVNSGSRDALVLQHDPRSHQSRVATMRGHQQEVCGLAWSADGSTLASGGNENFLCLWDAARSGVNNTSSHQTNGGTSSFQPRIILRQHHAAVKALAWCPSHRNLLASGGGTADRTIKFWNAHTGAVLQSVDTGSQVCALLWSRHAKEIVSSHGFSQNQLCLWRYPTMSKLCELTGHTARVLHLAQSPDGETVVSAAADETLRFWNIFASSPAVSSRHKRPSQSGTSTAGTSTPARSSSSGGSGGTSNNLPASPLDLGGAVTLSIR
eukprot:CAMPEP_0197310220 /NCGR_PEP_ID=MMETSP0891-20130614/8835_1 /TAXON_ID=44058 ORGANISM="Aureoumbra lagunensis, Strain CCMP1510" /NCGR_SAMPLE_ID=MMETSP0891 /ASSEMBLY_ACC=CAM_ASM_000534 /LENGTH=625 /DNA_ID=CAMNT_0042795761 /DNA_START=71 /DNA_END=1948 /DNA_ORIENTATION=+